MQFALLIHGTDEAYQKLSENETAAMYAEHERFGAMLAERGAMVGGAELAAQPIKVVRRAGEDAVVTGGPYAEAAEGVGGWYIVEAEDVERAVEYAKQLPTLPSDHVEVRRVMGAADPMRFLLLAFDNAAAGAPSSRLAPVTRCRGPHVARRRARSTGRWHRLGCASRRGRARRRPR